MAVREAALGLGERRGKELHDGEDADGEDGEGDNHFEETEAGLGMLAGRLGTHAQSPIRTRPVERKTRWGCRAGC